MTSIVNAVAAHPWLILLMAGLAIGLRLGVVAWVQHRKRAREIQHAKRLNDQHQPRG